MDLTSLTFCQIYDHVISSSNVIQCDTHLVWKDNKFTYAMIFFTDDNYRVGPHTCPTHRTKSGLLLITTINHEHVNGVCNYKHMQKYRLPGIGFRYRTNGVIHEELPVRSLRSFLEFIQHRIETESYLVYQN